MLLEQVPEFEFDEVDDVGFLNQVHLVHEDEDVVDSDLAAQQHVLLGLRHRPVHRRHHQYPRVHLRCPRYHVFHVVDVSRAVHVRVVPCLGLVLQGSGVDGDASGLFLGGLINFGVFYVLGLLLGSEILCYG